MPDSASSLEYDPVSGLLYLATYESAVQFYSINLGTNTATPVAATLPFGYEVNFAVDPNGQFLYVRNGGEVDQINIATGAVIPFVTGLSGIFYDLVFGSSSSGSGSSLYIGDGETVFEVQGFAAIVPEPASAALLFGGGALLALRRRRTPAGA